jgi:hypothetical protein
MKKLALGALFGFLAACGGKSGTTTDAPVITTVDGSVDAPALACNVLAQTGCAATEKCTWIEDQTTPTPLGHIGCVPNGAAAAAAACTTGPAGPMGYDNCVKGNYCLGGTCKPICDDAGGAPMCGTGYACGKYSGLFGAAGMEVAGICDPTCEPITQVRQSDNSPNCGGALDASNLPTVGCYGYWADPANGGTKWTCARVPSSAKGKVNGSVAGMEGAGNLFINSCMPGYQPLLRQAPGSSTILCTALCRPADTYMGNPAGNALHGGVTGTTQAPTSCANRGAATPTTDCIYGWINETDMQGAQTPKTAYSDTTGYCIDIAGRQVADPADATGTKKIQYPACSSLPKAGSTTAYGAKDFGCVSHDFVTAFDGAPARKVDLGLRKPYGALTLH